MNLELFEKPATSRASARRRAMEDARARAETGMRRAAEHNEYVNAGWCGMALHELRKFAAQMPRGAEWTIEAAREVIEPKLPRPTDARAWGQVVQAAASASHRYIERTGRSAPTASSNASPKPLWRRGEGAGAVSPIAAVSAPAAAAVCAEANAS